MPRSAGCRRTWTGWGIRTVLGRPMLTHALMDVMLLAGSPLLEDLGDQGELFVWLRSRELNNARRHGVEQLARTLVEMGVLGGCRSQRSRRGRSGSRAARPARSTSRAVWLEWTRRWFETSTAGPLEPPAHLLRADQSRPLAARRAPRPGRPGIVGSRARRRVDRGGRPAEASGELSKSLNANCMRARYGEPLLAALEGAADRVAAHRSSATCRSGSGSSGGSIRAARSRCPGRSRR